MTQHWQEILPVDSYQVSADGILYDYDRKTLALLYQPLIGSTCFSLYMTLWAQLEENRMWSTPFTHHSLMNLLDENLKTIYHARLKLEGIGLLKTFVRNNEEGRSFVYELQRPLSPAQFFHDGMLNVYLFGEVGKKQYFRLKQFFSDDQSLSHDTDSNYTEITKPFDEIYSSSGFQYGQERLQELDETTDQQVMGREEQRGVTIHSDVFDFELFFAGIKDSLVPKEAFTPQVMEVITKLSFLYGITPLQMKNIVIGEVSANEKIDIEKLRLAARVWYQTENNNEFPKLVDQTQPVIYRTQHTKPKTQDEEYIYYLETTSPREFLRDRSDGVEPTATDLRLAENVMIEQKLPAGVVNVLLDYVMLQTDKSLPRAYVETIAGNWSRIPIQTVPEAMEQAKKWVNEEKKKPTKRRKLVRSEKLPDWFVKRKEAEAKQAKSEKVVQEEELDFEAEKRKLEARLKKYKK